MLSPYTHRGTFRNVQLIAASVYEVELTKRILAMQLRIAIHGCLPIKTRLHHRNPIQDALSVLRMSFQGLDDEPLVRISCAHLRPIHTVITRSATGLFGQVVCRPLTGFEKMGQFPGGHAYLLCKPA